MPSLRIFYWRKGGYLTGKKPTRETFATDYMEIPRRYTRYPENGTGAEAVFNLYNDDRKNPLRTPLAQKWIGTHLQPHPHTTMSTGDIVAIDDVYWLVLPMGWERIPSW